ncbi:MAG TPA: universal stress protein [Streptosporangiaceae bacterium]|nr:universal stress protein [Streptosporangiaceae bacterium]
MSVSRDLQVAVPAADMPDGGGSSFQRILIPVSSAAESAEALDAATRICSSTINSVLRLLHVRIYDPPMPRCPCRFYPETSTEAAALLDEAMLIIWGGGAQATTAVMDAPRGEVAAAIVQQASAWRADVIVLTRRPRPAISRMLLGSVADQVMRMATCPVLTVHPNRK